MARAKTDQSSRSPDGTSLDDRVSAALSRLDKRRGATSSASSLEDALEEALDRVARKLDSAAATRSEPLWRATAELQALLHEVRERAYDSRIDSLRNVHEALGRLENAESAAQIIERAPTELCQTCDFDRAIFFRVEGDLLMAESAHFTGEPDWAESILDLAQKNPPRLHFRLHESEMVRRRRPILIVDAQNDDRTFFPLVEATQTLSYVAAPILEDGRVVACLHADRYFSGRSVIEDDVDVLRAFVTGLGWALRRTQQLERMRSEREQIRQVLMADDTPALDDIIGQPPSAAPPSLMSADDAAGHHLLTRRGLDVLDLLAEGSSNAEIAERLVISQATVKSHVKHIMRKLGAANRTEAVARFRRLGKPSTTAT
jgi:LuxR family transcriptional regulator, regulator of acetate metabolism